VAAKGVSINKKRLSKVRKIATIKRLAFFGKPLPAMLINPD
jgi:hypothetical protein